MTSAKLRTNMDVDALVAQLASNDPVVREKARESLVALGSSEVTAALVAELSDPRDHVRWEAAKTLTALADPVSAPALANAMDDDNEDVRWVAAEGLIALGKTGVVAVLHVLPKRASSLTFRQSASHVLHGCAQFGYANILAPVNTALRDWEPGASTPLAAFNALSELKVSTCQKA